MEISITIFIVEEQSDLILEKKLSDFLQRIYFKLLKYSYILIYLLCSSVLQWIFSIVLALKNLFESENHQEAGWYMSSVSKQSLKLTQFSQSELKSSNKAHLRIILLNRQWLPHLFRLNAIIVSLFLSYYLKVMDPYREKLLENVERVWFGDRNLELQGTMLDFWMSIKTQSIVFY